MLRALTVFADVTAFSDTRDPLVPTGIRFGGPVSPLPYVSGQYDATVSVVGNSHFHLSEMNNLLRYGGACIAHDARMVDFYARVCGEQRATAIAGDELGRTVTWPEVERWLLDQRVLPTLFLSEVVKAAHPLVVHSPVTQERLRDQFGTGSVLLPFAIYHPWDDAELGPEKRSEARQSFALPDDEVVVATFGSIAPEKAPAEVIWAAALLRDRGVNVRLWFIGIMHGPAVPLVEDSIEGSGMRDRVHFIKAPTAAEYRRALLAADLGIQLRTYGLGGLSGALLDCIARGLPTVANAHLAETMLAPAFVRRVPDGLSPFSIADAVQDLLVSPNPESTEAQRLAFIGAHNFENYSRLLVQALGFAP